MKILMCPPTFYDIEYEINPWMNMENQPDRKLAKQQWEKLYNTYLKLGVKVELIDQVKGLPDMVFVANAGTVYNNKFVSGNFRYKERKEEEKHFQKWFKKNNFKIITLNHFQGGEGDALFYKDTLYMGYGFRSDTKAHKQMGDILNVPIVSLHLIDPYFYDFDTAFCPIGEKGFLYYPEAFSKESQLKLAKVNGAVPMTKTQAQHFIGNTVYVNGKVLVSYLDNDLKSKLKALNVEPIKLDMSEFKKSGGGIKCLTLYIER